MGNTVKGGGAGGDWGSVRKLRSCAWRSGKTGKEGRGGDGEGMVVAGVGKLHLTIIIFLGTSN